MPIQRCFRSLRFYPIPTFGVPVPKILITAVFDEVEVFPIRDQPAGDRKFVQVGGMPAEFVVITKSATLKTNFILPFWYLEQDNIFHSARTLLEIFRIPWKKGVMPKYIFNIRKQKLLMLLFVVQA